MSARADYADGRDAVSGDLVTLVPSPDLPEHFSDAIASHNFEAQADAILSGEERESRQRDRKLSAAIGALRALIREAEDGDGLAAGRVIQAATADLIVGLLCDQLRAARALIPLDAAAPEIARINAALAAAGAT